MESCKGTVIVGHKANSFRKIKKYLSLKVPVIEMDVIKHDEDIVLQHVHEPTPIPIHSGRYLIHTFERFSMPFIGLKYVKLIDVLKLINGKVGVMLDLKIKGIANDVVDIIKESKFKGTIYVTSKYHKDIRKFKELMPEVKALLTLEEQPINIADYIKKAHADGVSIDVVFIDEPLVNELHRHGYIIASWTVNEVELAKYLISLRVDMIVTDEPETLMKEICKEEEEEEVDEAKLGVPETPVFLGSLDHLFGYEVGRKQQPSERIPEEEEEAFFNIRKEK